MNLIESAHISLHILIIDDELLARTRLIQLLRAVNTIPIGTIGQVSNVKDATEFLENNPTINLLLLDIHMPGIGGLAFLESLRNDSYNKQISVILTTASLEHALNAFDLDAIDYLTKPIRFERLQKALEKASQLLASSGSPIQAPNQLSLSNLSVPDTLVITVNDRGNFIRLSINDIYYCKAEQKYTTLRTKQRIFIYDASLNEIEKNYPQIFLRLHRNTLVNRHAIKTLEKYQPNNPDTSLSEDFNKDNINWIVRLNDIPEILVVSRRQLSQIKEFIGQTKPYQ